MRRLHLLLCKRLLPAVLENSCPSRIPRSGDAGERVNCFVVAIERDADPYLVAEHMRGDVLECVEWDGTSYAIRTNLPVAELPELHLRITHYYGLAEVRYSGIFDLLIGRYTGWPYIKIWLYRIWDRLQQESYNRRKIVTKRRMDLLRLLVEKHAGGSVSSIDLMTELYSIRWVMHPDSEAEQQRIELYLDSLVRSGDLQLVNHDFAVTGQALSTIERYEEEERRHGESVGVQRRMWWLTLLIALLTLVQAGIVKLPTLLDISGAAR